MKKFPKVIRYPPYFESISINNKVFIRDRDIRIDAKDEIKKFENELRKKGLKFVKKRIQNYYRYWIEF